MTPGQLLRAARRRHGVTQQQLAARARTSQAAISRIERDVVSPSVATLSTLLDLLGEELELSAHEIDYGHDRTLLRRNLAMRLDQRLDQVTAFATFALTIKGRRVSPERFAPRRILHALIGRRVDFVLVGRLAGTMHGSAYGTDDVDITCPRARGNAARLAAAVEDLGGSGEATSRARSNPTTFQTCHGRLDVFSERGLAVPFRRLHADAETMELDEGKVRVSSLDHLIALKEAAGRPRDKLMATEYRVLADEIRRPR
jgi:transcriptional regulator with XRE-family HTH domain